MRRLAAIPRNSNSIRVVFYASVFLVVSGCTADITDPETTATPRTDTQLSGEIVTGYEAWPPGGPGYVNVEGTSFYFRVLTDATITIFGNWTPDTPLGKTLEWTLFEEHPGSGADLIMREQASGGLVRTVDVKGNHPFRIDVHPAESGATAQQRVHVDVVGPSESIKEDRR